MTSHRRESTSLSQGLERTLILSEIMGPAEVVLQRSLSVRSTNSTQSSFATRMNDEVRSGTKTYTLIGMGTLGTVFELGGTPLAAKLGPVKGRDAIWKDAILTNRASEAYLGVRDAFEKRWLGLKVPRVPQVQEVHMDDDKDFWTQGDIVANFPAEFQRSPLYIMDRILPLAQGTRDALIQRYFPRYLQKRAMDNSMNSACIVRPYFGQLIPTDFLPGNLLNFPMYADEMYKLRLDVNDLAREMAMGLAIIHWQACIYGDDIEFVLGTAAAERHNLPKTFHGEAPRNVYMYDFSNRETHLWMFDFDKTDIFDLNKIDADALVQRLVTAVTGNDPYFPTPKIDQAIFDSFCDTYKQASEMIMKRKLGEGTMSKAHIKLNLPQRFIDAWARHIEEYEDPDIQFEGAAGDEQG